MSPTSLRSGRSVVVTNAGAGLGREIALGLAAVGYIVFGTARSAAEAQDLKDASGGRVSLTVCDVTKAVTVEAWACGVAEALGPAGLNLLINNVGKLTIGPIEILPLDAVRQAFEVNVFGILSVTNAFLPALRKARGRILQVSTWTASLPLPFDGLSGASKAAIEAFSAVYRAELKPFGIDVVIVPVGNMKSGGAGEAAATLSRSTKDMSSEQRKLYGKAFSTFARGLEILQATGTDVTSAAARVIEIAEQHPAPIRTPVGVDAERVLRAAREMADAELDTFRLKIVGLI